ncbi:MAG TPA: hypothetical protein VK454_01225, partial [Myxococcaceae bacterium]|nr:hypothetical protein [Myxococcaceae bacterium]
SRSLAAVWLLACCSSPAWAQANAEPAPAESAADSPSLEDLEKRYAGTYVYAGTAAEQASIREDVYSATEGMVGKDIARKEIMKRSEIRPTYTISFDAKGMVKVETPGYPPEISPLDGTQVKLKTKYGDNVDNSQRFIDGALVQRGKTHDGDGSTTFILLPDGKTLLVTRLSRSPKLPRPVVFSLTYVRQGATP